jgi:protein involved in polysaccharide export with SLBB domain
MGKVMIENHVSSDIRLRWNRVCGFLLSFRLVILLCSLFAVPVCDAQAVDQVENQTPYLQTGQSTDQQTGLAANQQPCQATDQQFGQATNQQAGQAANQQFGQAANQQFGQAANQKTGQAANQQFGQETNLQPCQSTDQQAGQFTDQQAGQLTDQLTLSADQIVDILRQEPEILASIKIQVAQRLGMDPSAISDDAIYDRIPMDTNLRDLATHELARRGYNTGPDPQYQEPQNPTENVPAKRASQPSKQPAAQVQPYENPDNPQVQHKLSPYINLPSLRELYSQFPTAERKLRRFGSDTFVLGTGNANELPMDLPAGPDYVLGTGDNLVVNLWGSRSDRLRLTIDRQGQIALPEAGTITIDGLSIAQAQVAIQKALDTQFQNEHIEISLGRVRTVRVYVVGDVQRPGAYDISSLSTPLNALFAAGGPTNSGSLRTLRQYRGTQLIRDIDLYDLLLHGIRSDLDRLQPGDTLLVPPVGPQVSVSGMVRRPAIYELKDEQGLNQVLDLAGGVLVSASLKQIRVERIEAHQSRTMLSLQLPEGHGAVTQDLATFRLQDGDNVLVSQILPYNEKMVYLDGHVFHPGKYPYREGMTVTDLLHTYQDMMPEPADHAELVRLQAPDYRPQSISFNLPDVLIGNETILLQPFDLIRIFGRYEIDSPRVLIEGDVLRPGKYPMSQSMTVAGLVRMAGGFKRSAYRDEADLSSYVVQNGQKVLVKHSIVAIEKALEGDKSADIALQPGDVVSIRRLAGWQDIGASVKINGEVEHAGSYGIEQGERLSSVLKRAGGFRESAYPSAAVLERVQVRELAEQDRQQMIQRIETTPVSVRQGAMSTQAASDIQQSIQQQRQQTLTALRSHPANGRLVINITSDIRKWENTSADIEMRAGDTLVIPKRPNFVIVSGQVYNPTAISYVPGRDVGWYLRKAGGTTPYGDKKHIYVLRADGSVVAHENSWMKGNSMNLRLRPGDSLFVPEKITGGSPVWQNILGMAQIMSAAALPIAIAGSSL